jgi:hypothetical protein
LVNRVQQRLVALAAGQWGMVTQEQALQLSPLLAGRLRLGGGPATAGLVEGVYEVDHVGLGAPEPAAHPFPRTLARWLRLDPGRSLADRNVAPDLVASFTTAAWLHGLLPARDVLEVISVPLGGSDREASWGDDVAVHRRETVPVVVLDGIAVTTVSQTLADLASVPMDITDLARFVDGAIRRRLASPEELVEALGGRSQGRARLRELLAVAGDPQ